MGFIPGIQDQFNIQKSISVSHRINRPKKKIHMVVSMWEKPPFIITTLSKLEIERNF